MQPINHKTQAENVGKAAWKVFEGLNGCVGGVESVVSGSTEIGYYLPESTNEAMLVNAIQKQQEVIEKQDERITRLEEKYEAVFGSMDEAETANLSNEEVDRQQVKLTGESLDRALLYQNEPNPFKGTTTIRYYLPNKAKNAQMVFVSTENGRVLKEVALSGDGMGKIEVDVTHLPAGSYTYTLVVDGQQELSRQMVLSK